MKRTPELLLMACLFVCSILAHSQRPPAEAIVPGRLVVVYRNGSVPANADAIASAAGAHSAMHLRLFGLSALQVQGDESAAIARLRSRPEVKTVLHDRLVTAHAIALVSHTLSDAPGQASGELPIPVHRPVLPLAPLAPYDTAYDSPQGWAVIQSGGFGDNVPGGPATGPWNVTLGAGSRIAVLDSGVDSNHPDIAPNLVLNLSEVNQEALPSPCDDASPQDQQGHGTWTASLATGALGPTTGQVIGVAPHAALLNIKVLQRMPGYGAGTLTQCENGQAGGLLSWVLQGIEDAVSNHADVVSLSLGTLVDTSTGDGAGWLAQFDSATYAAAQAGVTIVAALGNDGMNLSSGTLVELPAQSRSVLPVVAATNPACAENVTTGAVCAAGPITRPYYSNYGATLNAIAAPGGSYPEGPSTGVSGFVYGACSNGLTNTLDGLPATGRSFGCFGLGHTSYVQAMGTSASAPLVAGAAALLHAAHPGWTPAQIVAALRSSASSNPAMAEPELNLATALTLN
jgi:subtilisin family serine protease